MFTGIVTDIGTVRGIRPSGVGRDTRIEIETAFDLAAVPVGASIACAGPCLTVVEKRDRRFSVEASAETLARTTLGEWTVGTRVNLERSLAAGAPLDGHIVTGHVDAVVPVLARREEGGSLRFEIGLAPVLARFVVEKGSVALDGVSLTVNEAGADRFGVNIIAHTAARTTFGLRKVGDRLNMEVDVLARYVERQLAFRR